MKALFYCDVPFMLAHGGAQIQIQETKTALESIGVEVDWLRWWDDRQQGDLIHVFGTVSAGLIELARTARIPVVLTSLLTAACNYPARRLQTQRVATRVVRAALNRLGLGSQLHWTAFHECARNVVGLRAEQRVLEVVHGIPAARIAIVPLGLSEAFRRAGPGKRSQPHLICTGTITARKRAVELAELARRAQVPVLFVGKPYAEQDPYWHQFRALIDGTYVKHHPHVEDVAAMIALLQESRGFVLLSRFENWCLSAHEAIACGLPILVPNQNWSQERFGEQARYWPAISGAAATDALRQFYADCPALPAPAVHLHGWSDAARALAPVYQAVLAEWRGGTRPA